MGEKRLNREEHATSFPGGIERFLSLPAEAISDLVREKGKPMVGIFVPDGNQRLVKAETGLREDTEEFFTQVALTQTTYGLDTLKVFFGHGLSILFAPLFSRSVLARGPGYHRLTALTTLEIMFASDEWLAFYDAWQVRVRVYGDLSVVSQGGCEPAREAIERVQQITQTHTAHTLFLGIGGEPWVGQDAVRATGSFYQEQRREPSRDELLEVLYGQAVPPADFFIMSSKLAGLGALPALICGGDTQVYYLPVPGVIGLTQETYRTILYDLLYLRDGPAGKRGPDLSSTEREQLRAWYNHHANRVIGLGSRVADVWLPHVPGPYAATDHS
jgi:hypothetical protein